MNIEIIGYIGAALLSLSFIPQVYMSFKQKEFGNLSPMFIFLNISASGLLLAYAIINFYLPILIANGVVLLCNLLLVLGAIIYRNHNKVVNTHYDTSMQYKV